MKKDSKWNEVVFKSVVDDNVLTMKDCLSLIIYSMIGVITVCVGIYYGILKAIEWSTNKYYSWKLRKNNEETI